MLADRFVSAPCVHMKEIMGRGGDSALCSVTTQLSPRLRPIGLHGSRGERRRSSNQDRVYRSHGTCTPRLPPCLTTLRKYGHRNRPHAIIELCSFCTFPKVTQVRTAVDTWEPTRVSCSHRVAMTIVDTLWSRPYRSRVTLVCAANSPRVQTQAATIHRERLVERFSDPRREAVCKCVEGALGAAEASLEDVEPQELISPRGCLVDAIHLRRASEAESAQSRVPQNTQKYRPHPSVSHRRPEPAYNEYEGVDI